MAILSKEVVIVGKYWTLDVLVSSYTSIILLSSLINVYTLNMNAEWKTAKGSISDLFRFSLKVKKKNQFSSII